jgi:hypothetical protein
MFKTKPKTAYALTILILILAVVAAAGGLFVENLYRDNPFVAAVWRGNDLVTLVIAVPLLLGGLILSRRGSVRGQFVWLGMLWYMVYNYAYILFGAAFNPFFLFYVALFTLPLYALIFALPKIDVEHTGQRFRSKTPVRWIAGYMVFVAVGLSVVYLIQIGNYAVTGEIPSIVTQTDHPTNIVFALDLSLLVPPLLLGAAWLWQRRAWGYILAIIVNIKGFAYTLVLAVASLSAARAGFPEAAAEIPLWLTLTTGGLLASLFLLINIQSKKERLS